MNLPSSKVEADRQLLIKAREQGGLATFRAYLLLSGPGWLQSAITLGGGSLANGLFLGIYTGVALLWVQPLAMALGIVMLSAISYVTISTQQRPFGAINRYVSPVLGWAWLLASLTANMVWCLPQYSLASSVLQENLLPGVLGPEGTLGDFTGKLVLTVSILVLTTAITWAYDSGGWGIKIYEWILKGLVAMIVVCFFGVVLALRGTLDWGQVAGGFVPDFTQLFRPSADFAALLQQIPEDSRDFWSGALVKQQLNVIIAATATAVGINMTFLFPYSILAKGWGRDFRGFAIFDLAVGMLIPFLLATTCVVIAAASQFHPRPDDLQRLKVEIDSDAGQKEIAKWAGQKKGWLAGKQGVAEAELGDVQLTEMEQLAAVHLMQRNAGSLARSLSPFTGPTVANLVFGIGVLGMTLSTITLLMLISGFCVCEMLGLPASGWPHRLGCLAAATGALGPFVWSGKAQFWLAVPTSVFGMVLLPIAYWSFFLLMNQRSLLGKEMPEGGRRLAWNSLMLLSAGVASLLSVLAIYIRPEGQRIAGFSALGGLVAVALIGHFVRQAGGRPTPPPTE